MLPLLHETPHEICLSDLKRNSMHLDNSALVSDAVGHCCGKCWTKHLVLMVLTEKHSGFLPFVRHIVGVGIPLDCCTTFVNEMLDYSFFRSGNSIEHNECVCV